MQKKIVLQSTNNLRLPPQPNPNAEQEVWQEWAQKTELIVCRLTQAEKDIRSQRRKLRKDVENKDKALYAAKQYIQDLETAKSILEQSTTPCILLGICKQFAPHKHPVSSMPLRGSCAK